MIRGTTQTLRWNMKQIPSSMVTDAYMTIRNRNGRVIEKDMTSAQTQDHYVIWKLTQAETLQMMGLCEIQLRFKLTTGDVKASPIYRREIGNILKKGEI